MAVQSKTIEALEAMRPRTAIGNVAKHACLDMLKGVHSVKETKVVTDGLGVMIREAEVSVAAQAISGQQQAGTIRSMPVRFTSPELGEVSERRENAIA